MSRSDYSFAARLLHRLALGSRAVAESAMDLDRMLYPADPDQIADAPHVFVAGLARAGTTILMRQIHATGAFRSLTYRDMPFVLAPNIWARFSGGARRQMAAQERAHGDGIQVDFDSPEALEEVFWRITCADSYILENRLVPMQASADDRAAFRAYLAAILRATPGKRYLSKNNNNILRLPVLAQTLPDAIILVPFRDPLDHARSLMRQHQLFLERHAADPFARRYMTWLAHHEFGADHKPFVFDPGGPPPAGDPARDLAYWVQLWWNSYDFIARTAPASAQFICYERLCDDSAAVWSRICAQLGLPDTALAEKLARKPAEPSADGQDFPDLMARCRQLYDQLCDRAL